MHKKKERNESGDMLALFCQANEMNVTKTYFQHCVEGIHGSLHETVVVIRLITLLLTDTGYQLSSMQKQNLEQTATQITFLWQPN